MKNLKQYPKILIGTHDDEKIYLSPPSWDCGWYWGFGYLGNNNCHYHVDGLTKISKYDFEKKCFQYEFVDLHEGFKRHFGNSLTIRESKLWTLCELFQTFYTLKETAELLGRGGSHYTHNPCESVIKNIDEAKRINEIVLPAIFEEIYLILEDGNKKQTQNKKILSMLLDGDTNKIVDYMLTNKITTDDLKNIDGVSDHDFNIIHSYYWKKYHANKNN